MCQHPSYNLKRSLKWLSLHIVTFLGKWGRGVIGAVSLYQSYLPRLKSCIPCKSGLFAVYSEEEHGSWASVWLLDKTQTMETHMISCIITCNRFQHSCSWQYISEKSTSHFAIGMSKDNFIILSSNTDQRYGLQGNKGPKNSYGPWS